MGSKKEKKKRTIDEVTAEDSTPVTLPLKRSKKLKKSKKHDESTTNDAASENGVEVAERSERQRETEEVEDTKKNKKPKKSKKMTPAQETYLTSTTAERRAWRKAARNALMINGLSDGEMFELLAQREEHEELRKLAILDIVPLEIRLHRERLKNEETADCGSEEMDISEDEDYAASITTSPARQADAIAGEAQVEASEGRQDSIEGNEVTNDVECTILNETSPLDSIKSLKKPRDVIDSIPSESTTLTHRPIRPEMTPLESRTAILEDESIPSARSSGPEFCPAEPETTACDQIASLPQVIVDDAAEHEQDDVDSQYIILESQYVSAVMGKGGENIRVIEEETESKILFLISETLGGMHTRCRITGRPKAIASAKNRIYWAEAALRRQARAEADTNSTSQQQKAMSSSALASVSQGQPQSHGDNETPAASQASTAPSTVQTPRGSEVFPEAVELAADSPVFHDSACSEHYLSETRLFTQKTQTTIHLPNMGVPIRSPPQALSHEPSSALLSSPHDQVSDQNELTNTISQATSKIPENAVFIKIEDDSDSDSDFESSILLTAQHGRSGTAREVPTWLSKVITATFNKRKAKMKEGKRETHILKYALDYLGVSEEQMELLQQACNSNRSGKWDDNCRTIIGRGRIRK